MNPREVPQPGATEPDPLHGDRQMAAEAPKTDRRRAPYAPAFGTGSGGFVFRDYASI